MPEEGFYSRRGEEDFDGVPGCRVSLQGRLDVLTQSGAGRHWLVAESLVKSRGEIALSETCQDDDNGGSLELRPACELHCGVCSGAGGYSSENALFLTQPTAHGHGLLAGDVNDLIDNAPIQDGWDEVGADSLDFVRGRVTVIQKR